MCLHLERGFGCALLLSMEIQPLGCCFDGFVLRLRLLVASVPGSPAGGRDGACLTLDQVVRCSSTSGAEFEFWRPGTLCWSPVSSTLRQLENLSVFLGFFEVMAPVVFLPLLVAPSLDAPQRGPVCFCRCRYLSGLRAGDCGLPLRRRSIHTRVWLVACLPLLREWRTAPSQYP